MLLDSFFWQNDALEEYGMIYYPFQCVDGTRSCKIHIHHHGCGGSIRAPAEFSGMEPIDVSNFANYAASNDLIIVWPQVSWNLFAANGGCADSWGYSGEDYLHSSGPQHKFVRNIVERLTEPLDHSEYNYFSGNLNADNDFIKALR